MTNRNTEKLIENLFVENFHALVFTSFRIVRDIDAAKDIVQDVFVKIWQNFDSITHTRNLKSYLNRAVHNSSLNYLRDRKLHERDIIDIQATSDENQEVNEEALAKDELYDRVHNAVAKLPDKWREAFILNKYERLKYHEVAEKMGISIKTVEKYIFKALNFIRLDLMSAIILFISEIFKYKL